MLRATPCDLTQMNGMDNGKKRSPATVLLVDDHPVVLEGLTSFINQQSDLKVCGAVMTGREALDATDRLKPTLIVADISMAESDGIELIGNVHRLYPEMAMVVFSMHDEMLYAARALRAGARGYVMKNHGAEVLLKAIREVLSGRLYASERLRDATIDKLFSRDKNTFTIATDQLTDREIQVLRHLGQGKTSREIAAILNVSTKTVEAHREHIKTKLHLKNSTQLVHFATRFSRE